MFGNKKSALPPRPNPPLPEQILEDILTADKNDIIFKTKFLKDESQQPFASGDTELVYNNFKCYLSTRETLSELNVTLKAETELLKKSDAEMKTMAEDIRKQAQEALGKQEISK